MIRRRRRAAVALALLAAFALAATAAAQPITSVSWQPHAPTVEDVVLLEVVGSWYNGCVPRLASVHREPPADRFPELYPNPDLPIPIASSTAVLLESIPGDCTSAFTSFWAEVALSGLPAGNNRVLVVVEEEIGGVRWRVDVELVDIPVGGATHALPLHGGRFRATVAWRDFQGNTGQGALVPGRSRTSGLFTFFTSDNWEVMVKLLDGCPVNGHFWAFVAAATSVEYTLRIEDVSTGEVWEATNPLGELSPAFADTDAFGCAQP